MQSAPRTQRPNVIWIFGDQHRAQALGYRGDPNVATPHIDRLATDGVRFDAAVAGAPWCTPFRASLLTGLYPHQHGCTVTPSPLHPEQRTIAHAFTDAGYHTAWFGKWHLAGSNDDIHVPEPQRGGFAHWLGYENNNAQYRVHVHGTDQPEPRRIVGYETDALTDEFIQHLEAHVQRSGRADDADDYQPFFAVLSVQPPHPPYVGPAAYARRHRMSDVQLRPNVPRVPWIEQRAREELAGYYAMIENLDDNLGRVREALTRLNIDEHTIVMFFSDHGDMLGSHGQFAKNSPWEEAIRIPMIVGSLQRAGLTRMRKRSNAVLNHVDIAPTTLGLCGIEPPGAMAGHNYTSHILMPDHPHHRASPHSEPDSTLLQKIPFTRGQRGVNQPWRAIVTRDGWKYAVQPGHDWLLHNLNDDPFEQANLVYQGAFAAERRHLHVRLTQWLQDTGDDFAMPPLDLGG